MKKILFINILVVLLFSACASNQYGFVEEDEVISFRGYECTDDCSGHEAGYEWAERKGITNIYDCTGNSDSFIEGCEIYVEENF